MSPLKAARSKEEGISIQRIRRNPTRFCLGKRQGGNAMTNTKVLMRGVCVGAVLAASGMLAAPAQQLIAPASPTPVPGPIPDILQNYAPVTAERLKKPEDG